MEDHSMIDDRTLVDRPRAAHLEIGAREGDPWWFATAVLRPLAFLVVAGCASAPPVGSVPGSRPGLTDDPIVVAPGSVQTEMGLEAGRLAGVEVLGGELLVRFGVSRTIEARFGLETHGRRSGGWAGQAIGDPELSLKIALAPEPGTSTSPAIALLPSITLPVGGDALSSGGSEPGMLVVAGWGGEELEWTWNLGGTAAQAAAGRFFEVFLGFAVAHDLSERIAVEVEFVRTLEYGDHGEGPGLQHAAVGSTWLVHPDLQLDVWTAAQREGEDRGWLVGLGFSTRPRARGR
jgi:hypothetical protein